MRFIEADGGSVESQEQKALWEKKRENPRGSPFLGVIGVQGRYASIEIRIFPEGYSKPLLFSCRA
jgi:hypothetical protein